MYIRAQLTERSSVSCLQLHYLLPDKRDSSATDRLHHAKLNCSQPELINFEILFSPIACDYITLQIFNVA